LYNLKEDIGQKNNLAKLNPNKLKEMITDFEKIRGKVSTAIPDLKLE
jgi:hypothetical protein